MSGGVSVPQTFALFKIIPKASEVNDANMPRTAFDAVSLFYATGNSVAGERCNDCLTSTLNILAAGPDGKTEIKIGNPCICWECGFVGIPVKQIEEEIFECSHCKSAAQTNLVQGIQPDGSSIPWIEKKMEL